MGARGIHSVYTHIVSRVNYYSGGIFVYHVLTTIVGVFLCITCKLLYCGYFCVSRVNYYIGGIFVYHV